MGCIIKCVLSTELQTRKERLFNKLLGAVVDTEKRKKEWGVDLNEEQ